MNVIQRYAYLSYTYTYTQQRTAHLTYKLKDYLTLLKMFFFSYANTDKFLF
jgi:hypothetical protein